MNWTLKHFDELSPLELYKILRARIEVFIVEQNCIFQDADLQDEYCHHLMAFENNTLAAYTRIIPAGVTYKEASIGRVLTTSQFRKSGLGRELMQRSIEELFRLWGQQDIMIGAQKYLTEFYGSFGFKQVGTIYIEDNIEHIKMLRKQ